MKSKCTIVEIFALYVYSAFYVLKELYSRLFTKPGLAGKLFLKCEGRTAIVTGGTSGIGLETAKKLLSFGMNVIVGSNALPDEAQRCLEVLRTQFPRCKVEVWYVDLLSMDSVKSFAERFLLSGMPLHILINNAGVMFVPHQLNDDGFESHLAINYLSHCLLTKLLLPLLQQSSNANCHARIVNVSSCLHYLAKIDFTDLNSVHSYCPHQSYMQSKLFLVMFTKALHRYLSSGGCPVIVNCVHPGVIYSKLYKYIWWAPYLGPLILPKPSKGAEVCVYAALSAKLERIGGKYIEDCKVVKPSNCARSIQLQTRLWNETWKLLSPWLDEIDDQSILLDV